MGELYTLPMDESVGLALSVIDAHGVVHQTTDRSVAMSAEDAQAHFKMLFAPAHQPVQITQISAIRPYLVEVEEIEAGNDGERMRYRYVGNAFKIVKLAASKASCNHCAPELVTELPRIVLEILHQDPEVMRERCHS